MRSEAGRTLHEYVLRMRRRHLFDAAFPAQRAFLEDPSRLKAALCTRRAGKSYGIGLYLVDGALRRPGTNQLYLALTRESARRILFKDVLAALDARLGLSASLNKTTLEASLPNGSSIYLLGADADREEREKILGQKYFRVAIDECASFRTDLRDLVYRTIRPSTADERGTIALIGTPGNHKAFFHDVTTGKVRGWAVHRWSADDNPHVREQWAEDKAALLAENPRVAETPWYRQMYLGEWTTDTSALVYSGYDATRNAAPTLPQNLADMTYVLGVDLGFTDATALTLGAYDPRGDGTLYVLVSRKRAGLTVSQVADWIRSWQGRWPIHAMVADLASRQVVEELRQRHRLPIEGAEKSGKVEAIAMMNADLVLGRVRLTDQCAPLIDEWQGLVWDERALPKRLEHPGCPNHCADSALYMWRRATNYAARMPVPRPRIDTQEADDAEVEREVKAFERKWRDDEWVT